MSVTVSGTLTINVEGLEEQLLRLNNLKTKIDSKIQDMIQKVSKVAEADNWPHIQEGSEQLKKIYNAAQEKIEAKVERVKAEINKVLTSINQTETNVQNRFDQLLTDFRTRLQSVFGGGTIITSIVTGISNKVKESVAKVISFVRQGLGTPIRPDNSTGSIHNLFGSITETPESSAAYQLANGTYECQEAGNVGLINSNNNIDALPTPSEAINLPISSGTVSRVTQASNIATMKLKPILYLYPIEDKTNIDVTFEKPELLTTSYPKYRDGWNITANKNGDLYTNDGKYYYGLYWEQEDDEKIDFNKGFYVTKDNAIDFLEDKLTKIGLNDRERNEFIMYWLPILEKNEKSVVNFEFTEELDAYNKLNINPQPDSLLRILMNVKKVDEEVSIPGQELKPFERKGFVAVEWGGTKE